MSENNDNRSLNSLSKKDGNKFNNIEVYNEDEDNQENQESLVNHDNNGNKLIQEQIEKNINNEIIDNNNIAEFYNSQNRVLGNNIITSSNLVKMKFRIIYSSSETANHSVFELLKNENSNGWISERFCAFPQEIIIQFLSPLVLKQVNIISHENKISSQIELLTYYPKLYETYNTKDLNNIAFESLGYVKMNSNERSQFKARELKKIYLNNPCMYLKLLIHKNFLNRLNVFNQVGLFSIECLGSIIENPRQDNLILSLNKNFNLGKNNVPDQILEEEMDDITIDKLKLYKSRLNEALKEEDYDEAANIKKFIDKIKIFGSKIHELNLQKQECINSEDYDSAKLLKIEIDRLKSSVKNVEKNIPPLNVNSSVNMNNYNTANNEKAVDYNSSGEYNNNVQNTQSQFNNYNNTINVRDNAISGIPVDNNLANTKSRFQNTNQFSNSNNMGKSLGDTGFNANHSNQFGESNNHIMRSSYKTIKEQNNEFNQLTKNDDHYTSIDDRVIPALRNKDKEKEELPENQEPEKGELEELDKVSKTIYEPLLKYITEEDLRKLLSKSILYREEGLSRFHSKIPTILSDSSSQVINVTMKMILYQLSETHPIISIKTIEIFENMLNAINSNSSKELNYDSSLTDNILLEIKEKVGDINPKVRKRAVELYSFMMQKNFCDYNNLINELIGNEMSESTKEPYLNINKRVDKYENITLIGKQVKSSKVVLGKLEIIEAVLRDFDQAIRDKRTDMTSFPFNNVFKYMCLNLTHPKSDVRKFARKIVHQAKLKFGYGMLESYLKKVDLKELEKIVNYIPELEEYVKKENEKIQLIKNPGIAKKKDRSRSKSASSSGSKNSLSTKKASCPYCKKVDKKFDKDDEDEKRSLIQEHVNSNCVVFTNCHKCDKNLLVKNLNNHLLNECSAKDEFKMCMKCKEPIEDDKTNIHFQEGKCNPFKGKAVSRCPLCHKDIVMGNRGFMDHLTRDICEKNKRIDKYFLEAKKKRMMKKLYL